MSLVGPDGLLAGVTRTVLQAALEAEMTDHLGYDGVNGGSADRQSPQWHVGQDGVD